MRTRIPPPILALLFLGAMWGVDRFLSIGNIEIPASGVIAILLVVLGFGIAISATGLFRNAGTTVNPLDPTQASSLVTSGIFGYTRNPMYLGLFMLLTAWMIWLGNLSNLLLLAAFVWYMTTFQIKPEEEALSTLFGEPYDAYRSKVRRWI